MDFAEYLEELSDAARKLKVADLQRLSNLSPEQIAQLQTAWPNTDVRRRRRIVGELVDLSEDNVDLNFLAAFTVALADSDAEVRLGAIRGLWEDESTALIDPLIALADEDPDAGVRAEAALALGRFVLLHALGRLRERHFERVTAGLRRVIDKRPEVEEVRARAIEAVGAHDASWVRQAISEAYESGVRRLKVSAVHAMGRSAGSRWLPLLTRELNSDDAEVRYEAAVACGGVADEAAVPHLVALVDDPDADVRAAAVAALGDIGGMTSRNALHDLLDNPSKATREAAAAALAEVDFEEDPLGFRVRD
ncbi:MAG: HEAT repeat domain-containing protein [Dehalococcoidia bacterium]